MVSDRGPVPRPLRLARIAVLAAVICGLAVIAYRAMFVTFLPQDDDGYLIVSLRLFGDGQALYTDVYSQYGPGLYALVAWPAHLLGITLDSDSARFINLAFWLGSLALATFVMLRIRASLILALAGLMVSFYVLRVDANEPLHPGALLGLLVVAIIAVAIGAFSRWPAATMAALGALAAALLTIKVNVGIFATCSVLVACAFAAAPLPGVRWLRGAVGAAFVLVPWVLLGSHLDQSDTLRLALVVSSGALGLVVVASDLRINILDGRLLAWLGYGFAVVVGFVAFAVMLAGTSPGDLIDGWFVRPSQTPGIQFSPIGINGGALIFAGLGLAGAIAYAWRRRDGGDLSPGLLGAAGRLLLGLAIWASLASPLFGISPELSITLNFAVPFAWVAAIPMPGDSPARRFARLVTAAVAVLQVLHGFPVNGSQISWGEFPLIFVGAFCIADAIEIFERAAGGARAKVQVAVGMGLIAGIVWLCLGPVKTFSDQVTYTYRHFVPLDLPGAHRLRVSDDRYAQFHGLVRDIDRDCSNFITLPGLNSLYLFTERTPPTVLSGPWTLFFTDDDQQRLVDQLRDDPDLCVVVNREIQNFWTLEHTVARPLTEFIDRDFRVVSAYGAYQLAVRADRVEGGPHPDTGLAE